MVRQRTDKVGAGSIYLILREDNARIASILAKVIRETKQERLQVLSLRLVQPCQILAYNQSYPPVYPANNDKRSMPG
jgi:hypothetical protein